MEISQSMTKEVHSLATTATIADAARLMAKFDIGAVPVLEGGELKGIVTDRDIAIRAVAMGLSPDQSVVRAMTYDVASCRDTACIDDVLAEMVTHGVRRMPICAKDGKLVGIVTLGDLARIDWDKEQIGITVGELSGHRRAAASAPAAA